MPTPSPTPLSPLTIARERVLALQAGLDAAGAGPVRLVETHISWVLLAREQAWKFKKPLKLPFLDFSTLALRRHCCLEELRLNQRLAPGLYQGLADVCEAPDGGPRLVPAGEPPVGEPIEVAVQMRRFPDGALWSESLAAGRLRPAHIDAMATRLARFHQQAAVAPADSPYGALPAHEHTTQGIVAALDGWHQRTPPGTHGIDWPALRTWLLGQPQALAPHFAARLQGGFVREGHGDLHLANLLLLGDEPAAFDGIDFDAALRWIDVLDDLAFVVMDLQAQGAPALAWRLLDGYLSATGDHAGLPALRFFLVSRALVRAQVLEMSAGLHAGTPGGCDAAGYRRLAEQLARSASPRLAITHGLPGSGKSHAALALLERSGAIRLRSDVERKRLFGLAPLDSSAGRAPAMYGPEAGQRTYARLLGLAEGALAAGWPVVVDAAFLTHAERAAFAALAASRQWPFSVIDCQAPTELLLQRLAQRAVQGGDPSEADGRVLALLQPHDEALDADEQARSLVVLPAAGGAASAQAQSQAWDTLAARWSAMTQVPPLSGPPGAQSAPPMPG